MMDEVKDWRSDDMSLAAYLSLALEQDPDIDWDGDSCFFTFDEDPELLEAVMKYVSGQATVEPRQYNLEHGKLKKAMFACKPKPSRVG